MSALLAAGPSLSALHFALVQHRLCPEHGQLEHVSIHERTGPGALEEPPAGPALGPEGAGSELHGHQHDACMVSGHGSLAATLIGVVALARLAACARVPRGLRARLGHSSIRLLHYAPKLAPPQLTCA